MNLATIKSNYGWCKEYFVFHYRAIRTLEQAIKDRTESQEPLSSDELEYGTTVINGLHRALQEQVTPPYQRTEHEVVGWGLISTNLVERGTYLGIPTANYLGSRALYMSTRPGVIKRVLNDIHPRTMQTRTLHVSNTSAEAVLREDPSIVRALPGIIASYSEKYDLEYQASTPPTKQ